MDRPPSSSYPDVPVTTLIGSDYDDTVGLDRSFKSLQSVQGGDGVDLLVLDGTDTVYGTILSVAIDGTINTTLGHFSSIERFDLTLRHGGNVISLSGYDDVVTVAASGDNLLGGGGGDDTLTGGYGRDRLDGGFDDDLLVGGAGDDTLLGGAGDDLLDGGRGDDTAVYAEAGAAVRIQLADLVQDTGGAGCDRLYSIENVVGSRFDDLLSGNAEINRLDGGDGVDRLFGGKGADTLTGGAGADQMEGGAGADTFAFMSTSDSAVKSRDRIGDFSLADGDRIDLKAIDPRAAAGDQAFIFVGSAAFSHSGASELRATAYSAHVFLVQGDADGNGKADFSLLVTADAPLVAADFVL